MRNKYDKIEITDKDVVIYVSTSSATRRFISLPLSDVERLVKDLTESSSVW